MAESTAASLAERLDALAAALRAAGVPPERSAGLLAAAAEATMHAVVLDALLDERRPRAAAPAPPVRPAAPAVEPAFSLAA